MSDLDNLKFDKVSSNKQIERKEIITENLPMALTLGISIKADRLKKVGK